MSNPRRTPIVSFEGPSSSFRGYRLAPPLDAHVELVWFVDAEQDVARERVLPNGVVEVIVNLGPPHRVLHERGEHRRYRDAWVAGIQSRWLDIRAESRTSRLIGIRFRAGGAAPLLSLPMRELADQVIELDLVLGAFARELRERLALAEGDVARIEVVERMLLARHRPLDRRVARACAALAGAGARSVRGVADALGTSHKHLIDLFAREVGLSPKTWSRVSRFQRVLSALERGSRVRLADLAASLDYADQSHLATEFRAFAGTTVTQYLRDRAVDPNHLLLDA